MGKYRLWGGGVESECDCFVMCLDLGRDCDDIAMVLYLEMIWEGVSMVLRGFGNVCGFGKGFR